MKFSVLREELLGVLPYLNAKNCMRRMRAHESVRVGKRFAISTGLLLVSIMADVTGVSVYQFWNPS